MFNRSQFDKNQFDRGEEVIVWQGDFGGYGNQKLDILMATNFDYFDMSGFGNLNITMIVSQNMDLIVLDGIGNLEVGIVMRLPLNIKLNGNGDLNPGLSVATPIRAIALNGSGNLNDSASYLLQNIIANIKSSGTINLRPVMGQIMTANILGKGDMSISNKLYLLLLLNSINLPGYGNLNLRLGELNSDMFELDGISLAPGGEIIIDTDEYNVWINGVLDVNSVTSDSIFFTLQPGQNDITFDSDVASQRLDVTIIYNNRWL